MRGFFRFLIANFYRPRPRKAPMASAPTTLSWPIRPKRGVRQNDAAGSGAFGASRDGGSRRHLGIDLITKPGDDVVAPCRCEVTHVGIAYPNSHLGSIHLRGWDTWAAYTFKLLYVAPEITLGEILVPGEILGVAQDLTERYPNITCHVHFEVHDNLGKAVDPLPLLEA